MFSVICSTRVAPVMTVLTRGFLAHQASASCNSQRAANNAVCRSHDDAVHHNKQATRQCAASKLMQNAQESKASVLPGQGMSPNRPVCPPSWDNIPGRHYQSFTTAGED
jgi:hypothetical protein